MRVCPESFREHIPECSRLMGKQNTAWQQTSQHELRWSFERRLGLGLSLGFLNDLNILGDLGLDLAQGSLKSI